MRQLRNIHVCTVSSRQKLRFISKQNNFQTETVYTFTMTTAQVNDFKAGETRGKLWGVTRMWLVRREDDECILLQLWKWIIEENMRAKKRHWVKRLRLSAFTTYNVKRHNHEPSSGSGWCLWCDAMNTSSNSSWWFHLLTTTPSDRRFWYCNETKQVWHS